MTIAPDPARPPPLPPEGPPPPLPPEASAAGAVAPVPVMPLTYAHGAYRMRRPGVLVAMGVLSVVVGLLGLVAAPVAVVRLRALYRSVVPAGPAAAGPAASAASVPEPAVWPGVQLHFGDCVAPRGLKATSRDAAVQTVASALDGGLHADRREMLQRLLAECGQDVFGAESFAADRARRAVRQTGRRDGGPDGPRNLSTQYFRTDAGVVEINNRSATFAPAVGAGPVKVECDRVTAPDGTPRYSAVALDRILSRIHRDTGGRVNAAQAGALLEDLRQIVPDENAARNFSHGPHVSADKVGTATLDVRVTFAATARRFWLMPNGRYVANPQPDWDPDTGARRVIVAPGPARPAMSPDLADAMGRFFAFAVADAALSAALAALVAVAGVRTLMRGPQSYRLHRWYVVLKVALAFVSILIAQSLFDDLSWALGSRWSEAGALGGLFVGTLVTLAYPVFVFCVCATAGVRNYYQSLGGPLTLVPDGTRERLRRAFFASDWARWPPGARRALALAAAAVACFHAVAAFTPGRDNGTVLGHFALMLLAAGVAAVAWRGLMLRPRAALAVALAAACASAPAPRAAAQPADEDLPGDWTSRLDWDELRRMSLNELVLRAQFGQTRLQRKGALNELQGREDCKRAFAPLMRLFPTLDARGRGDVCEALTFVAPDRGEWTPEQRAAVEAALPAMLELFRDPGLEGERAGGWLARFYPPEAILPVVRKVLEPSSPWRMRFRAVHVLREVREPTEDVYRALVAGLGDPDQNVSNAARNVLESARPRSLPVLLDAAAKDPSPEVRAGALAVMAREDGRPRSRRGDVGPARRGGAGARPGAGLAPEVVAALEAAVKDPDPNVRSTAAVMIRVSHPRGLERLLRMLVEGDPATRALATREIARADARQAVPETRKLLAHRDPAVRAAAVEALRRPHPPGETSAPEVYALLDDPDALVRAAAAEWFAQSPSAGAGGVLGLWSQVAVDDVRRSGANMRSRFDVGPVAWEPPPGLQASGADQGPGAVAAVGGALARAADWGLWLQWPVFLAFGVALAAHAAGLINSKSPSPHPSPLRTGERA